MPVYLLFLLAFFVLPVLLLGWTLRRNLGRYRRTIGWSLAFVFTIGACGVRKVERPEAWALRSSVATLAGPISKPYNFSPIAFLIALAAGWMQRGQQRLIDRDTEFTAKFRKPLKDSGIETVLTPARCPQADGVAERFVGSARREVLGRLIFFGIGSLNRALREFVDCYTCMNETTKGSTTDSSSPVQVLARPSETSPAAIVSVDCSSTTTELQPESQPKHARPNQQARFTRQFPAPNPIRRTFRTTQRH